MQKIETITAFVATDKDGNEGVISQQDGVVHMPFVAADPARIKLLIPNAWEISILSGQPIRILQFSVRTDVTQQYFGPLQSQIIKHYVVYDHPRDFPGHYVVRKWYLIPGRPEAVPDKDFSMKSPDIETLRMKLYAKGLTRLLHSDGDDPCIMEIWL